MLDKCKVEKPQAIILQQQQEQLVVLLNEISLVGWLKHASYFSVFFFGRPMHSEEEAGYHSAVTPVAARLC